jgi:hypothetical protein
MYCANHPNVETELSCGRCGKPICTRCLVHMEVGIRCRECYPKPKDQRRRLGALVGVGAIGFLVVAVMAPRVLGLSPNSGHSRSDQRPLVSASVVVTNPSPVGSGQAFDLLATGTKCIIDPNYDFTECSGSVRNLGASNLQQVEVVVTLLSNDGAPQSSKTDRIHYDPLLPNQESPWIVEAPFNPALDKYSISFQSNGLPLRVEEAKP